MADVAVSKTVVERRASSTLASGTIPTKNEGPHPRPFVVHRPCELQRELLLAVEHGQRVLDGVVGQRDGTDRLGQAHGLI